MYRLNKNTKKIILGIIFGIALAIVLKVVFNIPEHGIPSLRTAGAIILFFTLLFLLVKNTIYSKGKKLPRTSQLLFAGMIIILGILFYFSFFSY